MSVTLANRHRALRLFKRHRRFITIAGALIVFITYLVNDVLRDNLSDALTAVRGSQAAYQDAQRDDELKGVLTMISQTTEILLTDERMAKNSSSTQAIANLGSFYLSQWNTTKEFTDRVLDIATTTPGAEGIVTRLKSNLAQLDSSKTANAQRIRTSALYNMASTRAKISQYDAIDALNLVDEAMTIAAIKSDTETALDDLEKIISKKVEHYEPLTRWTKRIGYALYALGWGLGLLGTMIADKESAGS
jgi:hypothetical protein